MLSRAIQSSDMLPGCKTAISSPVGCWESFGSFNYPYKLDLKPLSMSLGCMVRRCLLTAAFEGKLTPETGANDHVEAKSAGRINLSSLCPHLYRPRWQSAP